MAKQIQQAPSKTVGAAIMKRRLRKGVTQAELAETLGIEQHSLSRMEKGIIAPKFARLQDIADSLDCSVAELFRESKDPPDAKAMAICAMLEELPSELQDLVVNLVEDTVLALKKLKSQKP